MVNRIRSTVFSLCLLGLILSAATPAAASQLLIEASPVPGGIAIVEVGSNIDGDTPEALPVARWNDRSVAVIEVAGKAKALIGLPLSLEAGEQALHVTYSDGTTKIVGFDVQDFAYEEQRLVITDKRKVNPAPMDMERITAENKRLQEVKSYRADRMLADSFEWPVAGPLSSPFGLRRFFNEQPRRPHGGIDIAAPEGTPIKAPADGIVIETGDYFFNGNSVFIEHGLGLQTFYAHMSRIDVQAGERVTQGQVLGAVGKTGRVTGPHLHWSVGLNGTWVNPLLVLATDAPPAADQ